ncbi:hypothetical protein GWI34_22455 [Actinomadura sp. DSM 109109]|nr:hypothetical protein [Actinomadura lepetitiana]
MSGIHHPDLTWSAAIELATRTLDDLGGILEEVLTSACEAGLLEREEMPKLISYLLGMLLRDARAVTVKRQVGRPGIELRVRVTRNSWGSVFLTFGRTKRYTVSITAVAMQQPSQG